MRNGTNAASAASGIVRIGMTALGTCHRKAKMIAATVIMISTRVDVTLSIDFLIRSERS